LLKSETILPWSKDETFLRIEYNPRLWNGLAESQLEIFLKGVLELKFNLFGFSPH
jgi:hypothetical protein